MITKPLPALVFLHDKMLAFDRVVPAANTNGASIVLCHDESGSELYVPEQEWAAASIGHPQKQSAQLEQPEPQSSPAHQAPQTPAAPPEQSDPKPQQPPQPLVTTASTSAEKLALFRSLFKGRDDVHAQGYKKRDGSIGTPPSV